MTNYNNNNNPSGFPELEVLFDKEGIVRTHVFSNDRYGYAATKNIVSWRIIERGWDPLNPHLLKAIIKTPDGSTDKFNFECELPVREGTFAFDDEVLYFVIAPKKNIEHLTG